MTSIQGRKLTRSLIAPAKTALLAAPTEEDTHHVTIEGIEGKHVGKVSDYDGK